MNAFGFKKVTKVNDHQQDILKNNENTIRPTVESLQETQRNEYFGDKLTIKPTENLRIISLNINGLDLGKGENSLLQLCLNLQDKGMDLLCLTETNVNWQRYYLVQNFSATLKEAWPKQKTQCAPRTHHSYGTVITNLEEQPSSQWERYLPPSSPKEKTHTD